ncbi:MAG: FAD:protein FMN transferase, partial [Hyphomicrobiales bacterium]
MRLSRRRLIAISAAAAIAPGSARAAHGSAQWTGTAMGASASLKIVGVPHRKAQELISSARTEIKRLENQFSLHRNESTLSLLNKTGSLTAPPFEFLELLNLVDRMHEVTAGAFDPTVQTLWNAYASTKGCPSAQQVADALGHTGWKKV